MWTDVLTGTDCRPHLCVLVRPPLSSLISVTIFFRRLYPQLLLNSVTLVLDAADFLQLYYAANKGAQWKTGSSTNNRLIQVGGC